MTDHLLETQLPQPHEHLSSPTHISTDALRAPKQSKQPRRIRPQTFGLITVFVFMVGLVTAIALSNRSQDIRQQAYEVNSESITSNQVIPETSATYEAVSNSQVNQTLISKYVDPDKTNKYIVFTLKKNENNGQQIFASDASQIAEIQHITIPIPGSETKSLTFNLESSYTMANNSITTWSGILGKRESNSAPSNFLNLIVHKDGVVKGLLFDQARYGITSISRDQFLVYVQKTDLNLGDIVLDSPEAKFDKQIDLQRDLNTNSRATIDIFFGYTNNARQAAGGVPEIESAIALGIANTNTALNNSQTFASVNLVGMAETQYSETSNCQSNLDRLKNPGDGYMDELINYRNQSGADLLFLMGNYTNQNCGGIAWINVRSLDYAYGISFFVGWDPDYATYETTPHEIGHSLGGGHNADCCSPPYVNNDPDYGYGLYYSKPDNHGNPYTTMAYRKNIDGEVKLLLYSNPNLYYNGILMGSQGQNNARSIFDHSIVVANLNSPGGSGSGTCDNNVPVGGTACRAQGDPYQFRCSSPNPNQNWSQENCTLGNTCQGTACSTNAITCNTNGFQSRFRIKYLNGQDLGWLGSGTYTVGTTSNVFEIFEHAVFINQDVNQRWTDQVVVTKNGIEYTVSTGNPTAVSAPWSPGTYKIAPKINGVKCSQHESTITIVPMATPTPQLTPTPVPPVPPQYFQVIYNPSTSMSTLSWSNQTGVINYLVERCSGVGCTNFAQIATTTTSPYSVAVPTGQTHRYRVRGYNGSLGAYTPIIDSTVSWVIKAQSVCANGVTSLRKEIPHSKL